MADIQNKAIIEMKPQELEERLASAFKSVRGQSYCYMDCGGRHHGDWINVYDKIPSSFECSQREAIEKVVSEIMSKPGVHRIMDQGCGHAQSLLEVTRRMASRYPENEFLGYGISGSLKDFWLGGQEFDFRITPEQKRLIEKSGIHPFQERGRNYQFFGVEDDIHKVMRDFPYQLDLIFSDNTYFHLAEPWLALKRTVDKLTVGGVAMIRTIFYSPWCGFSQKDGDEPSLEPLDEEVMVEHLKEDNPDHDILSASGSYVHRVLAILKKEDIPFKTNLYVGLAREGKYLCKKILYSKRSPPVGFLPLDSL